MPTSAKDDDDEDDDDNDMMINGNSVKKRYVCWPKLCILNAQRSSVVLYYEPRHQTAHSAKSKYSRDTTLMQNVKI